jgi:hypothetical protein
MFGHMPTSRSATNGGRSDIVPEAVGLVSAMQALVTATAVAAGKNPLPVESYKIAASFVADTAVSIRTRPAAEAASDVARRLFEVMPVVPPAAQEVLLDLAPQVQACGWLTAIPASSGGRSEPLEELRAERLRTLSRAFLDAALRAPPHVGGVLRAMALEFDVMYAQLPL